jgi:hypothetical protein
MIAEFMALERKKATLICVDKVIVVGYEIVFCVHSKLVSNNENNLIDLIFLFVSLS